MAEIRRRYDEIFTTCARTTWNAQDLRVRLARVCHFVRLCRRREERNRSALPIRSEKINTSSTQPVKTSNFMAF